MASQDFKEDLYRHLSGFSTNPYLFVGSGLSRRYYNLPTWVKLLEDFYPIMKNSTDFNYYLSKCDNDPVKLASELSNEFHEQWWKDATFAQSRKKYSTAASAHKELPFKYELSDFVNSKAKFEPSLQAEIELLSKTTIDGIITTNWDDFLQSQFNDFSVFIGQQQLLFADSLSVGDIYKIHGCSSKPESLVLTELDYANFNSRNAYLAAKLLTIFVEHPIFFLGYSISDVNIIQIIDSIVQCLDSNNIHQLKDRLIFVEWDPKITQPTFQDGNIVLREKKVLPIKHIKLDSFVELYEVMGSLKKRLPLKVLRKVKESVYEIIKSNQPTGNIYVGELDNIKDDSQIEFVIGIGIAKTALSSQGYVGVEAMDLIEDIIFESKGYNSQLLVEKAFPKLAKGNSYIPMCKYLKEASFFSKGNTLNAAGTAAIKQGKIVFRSDMPDCFMPPKSYNSKKTIIKNGYKDISSFLKDHDVPHAILYMPFIERKNIDLKAMQQFLADVFSNHKKHVDTNFRKLVCLYDFYKHC